MQSDLSRVIGRLGLAAISVQVKPLATPRLPHKRREQKPVAEIKEREEERGGA